MHHDVVAQHAEDGAERGEKLSKVALCLTIEVGFFQFAEFPRWWLRDHCPAATNTSFEQN